MCNFLSAGRPLLSYYSQAPTGACTLAAPRRRSPIHTFSSSNQKCALDIANRSYLENEWIQKGESGKSGVIFLFVQIRGETRVSLVNAPDDSTSGNVSGDIMIEPGE